MTEPAFQIGLGVILEMAGLAYAMSAGERGGYDGGKHGATALVLQAIAAWIWVSL